MWKMFIIVIYGSSSSFFPYMKSLFIDIFLFVLIYSCIDKVLVIDCLINYTSLALKDKTASTLKAKIQLLVLPLAMLWKAS